LSDSNQEKLVTGSWEAAEGQAGSVEGILLSWVSGAEKESMEDHQTVFGFSGRMTEYKIVAAITSQGVCLPKPNRICKVTMTRLHKKIKL
jgi:hypothetical protein